MHAGYDHACAYLNGTGSSTEIFYCWGANDHGQVGDGTLDERHSPVRVFLKPPPPPVP